MDILRLFRKCFYCGGSAGLIHVVAHPAYSFTQHYYYHEECLKEVLCYPRDHTQYVDMALDISDCIEKEKREKAYLVERAEAAIKRAEARCRVVYEDV